MSKYQKAIFDEVHFNAFAKIALEEGLLFIDKKRNDNYNPYELVNVSEDVRRRVLEQLTLTPKIITTDSIFQNNYGVLSGQLIDEGIVEYKEKQTLPSDDKSGIDFIINNPIDKIMEIHENAFPLPIIGAMVNSTRTKKLELNEIKELLKQGILAYKEQLEYELHTGKNAPELSELSRILRETIGGQKLEDEYSAKEISKQKRRNEIYGKVNPIINVFKEFIEVTYMASKENALAKFASSRSIWKTEGSVNYTNKDVAIFRIVAEGLNRRTYRSTMIDTLKLSEDEATKALRIYIEELVNNIEFLSDSEVRKIRKEINIALGILSKNKNFNENSRFYTDIGLPVAALGLLGFTNPVIGGVVTIGGLAISLLGFVNSRLNKSIEDTYRWAQFDNN